MANPEPSLKPAVCSECGRRFKNRSGLSGHIQFKHTAEIASSSPDASLPSRREADNHQGFRQYELLEQLGPGDEVEALRRGLAHSDHIKRLPETLQAVDSAWEYIEELKRDVKLLGQLHNRGSKQLLQRVDSLEKLLNESQSRMDQIKALVNAVCLIISLIAPGLSIISKDHLPLLHTHRDEVPQALELIFQVAQEVANPRRALGKK